MKLLSWMFSLLSLASADATPDAGSLWDPWGTAQTDVGNLWDPWG